MKGHLSIPFLYSKSVRVSLISTSLFIYQWYIMQPLVIPVLYVYNIELRQRLDLVLMLGRLGFMR